MKPLARENDVVIGGLHCHGGHSHGPLPTPGRIVEGSARVFAHGRPVARLGDRGHSDLCCAGIGEIILQKSQETVFVEGRPAVSIDTPTLHCGCAPGRVATGNQAVRIP